jgi:hypothetical protein
MTYSVGKLIEGRGIYDNGFLHSGGASHAPPAHPESRKKLFSREPNNFNPAANERTRRKNHWGEIPCQRSSPFSTCRS